MPKDDLKALLTIPEAAKLLPHETESSLRRNARLKRINAVMLGKQWFLTAAEIARIKTEGESQ